MSTQYNQIISLISGCDERELRDINHVVCNHLRGIFSERSRVLVNQFGYGDEVFFIHKGRRHDGIIEKINSKTVIVNVGGLKWKCSPDGLRRKPKATTPTPTPTQPDNDLNVIDDVTYMEEQL